MKMKTTARTREKEKELIHFPMELTERSIRICVSIRSDQKEYLDELRQCGVKTSQLIQQAIDDFQMRWPDVPEPKQFDPATLGL